jgi:hypothetical protein
MVKGGAFAALALAGALVAPATAWAGGRPPSPAALSVVIASPLDGDLFEAPATVTVTGTASISGGSSSGYHDSSKPKLTSLEIAVDDGPRRLLTNAEINPDLPRTSPATVSFTTSVTSLGTGPHTICVKARSTSSGVSPASNCVGVEVVGDMVDCAVEVCELSATDPGVATANLKVFGIEKLVGLRVGELVPGECGGLDCITGFDALFSSGESGIAELTVITEKPRSTPPGLAAVFFDGVQVVAKCTSSSTLPCQKINSTRSGRTIYFVRFRADPGIRFR